MRTCSTQPARLRPALPLAARPRPGSVARGPGRPPRPTGPRPANHRSAGAPDRAGRPGPAASSRPPVRPPGLADELATLGRATPGHRNRTLNQTAFKVYRYVAGGLLDDQVVTLAFTTAALAIGLSAAETARTLASARTAGLANPRTVPSPPDPSRQEVGA
jgi:hypothetical protein